MTFFKSKQPWTKIKHDILENLLASCLYSLRDGSTFTYVDGLAGAGSYEDGSKGSPLIAFDIIDTIFDVKNDLNIDAVFVEQDKNNYSYLEDCLDSIGIKHDNMNVYRKGTNTLNIHHKQADFNDISDIALQFSGRHPGLTFIDPFGIKDLSDKVCQDIRKLNPKMNLVINFAIGTMKRLVGQGKVYAATQKTLEESMGVGYVEDNAEFFKKYKNQLKERYSGVSWLPLKNTRNRELFYMMLCTNDIYLFQKFNDYAHEEKESTSLDCDAKVLTHIPKKPQSIKNILFSLMNYEYALFKTSDYLKSMRRLLKQEKISRAPRYNSKVFTHDDKGITLKTLHNGGYLKNE